MSRITALVLARSIQQVRDMTPEQKEQLTDNLSLRQPTLLRICVVQHRVGIPIEEMDFLYELILICFQSMNESGLKWRQINENQWARQLSLVITIVQFKKGLCNELHEQTLHQCLDDHPEKMLFAFVMSELYSWLNDCGLADDNKRYVMVVAITTVNCIAYVPIPSSKKIKKIKTT